MDMDSDRLWRAIEACDPRFDGWVFCGVTSTGVYCRPSCPARTPRREHVRVFPSAAAAQAAGFRACKRCRPDATPGSPEWDLRADLVGRAMRLIADGIVEREGVGGLARRLGYTERHIHRQLVAVAGAGPLALARAQRAQTARLLLETTPLPVGQVCFAAGLPSWQPISACAGGSKRSAGMEGPARPSHSPSAGAPTGPTPSSTSGPRPTVGHHPSVSRECPESGGEPSMPTEESQPAAAGGRTGRPTGPCSLRPSRAPWASCRCSATAGPRMAVSPATEAGWNASACCRSWKGGHGGRRPGSGLSPLSGSPRHTGQCARSEIGPGWPFCLSPTPAAGAWSSLRRTGS